MRGHPTLQKVDLVVDYNENWGDTISSLASCPRLSAVTLRFAVHSSYRPATSFGKALLELVRDSPVRQLTLKDFPSAGIGRSSFEELLDALCYNRSLKRLSIQSYWWNNSKNCWPISSSTITSAAKALIANHTLEELDIPIDATHTLPIFQALPFSYSMRRVRVPTYSSKVMRDTLPLDLVRFLIGLQKGMPWHVYMTRDPSCLGVDRIGAQGYSQLDEDRIRRGRLEAVIDHREDTKFVHYVLSADPSLCFLL